MDGSWTDYMVLMSVRTSLCV